MRDTVYMKYNLLNYELLHCTPVTYVTLCINYTLTEINKKLLVLGKEK